MTESRRFDADKTTTSSVSLRYKDSEKAEQTLSLALAKVISPSTTEGDIVEKTKSKVRKFLKLDKLSQRVAQAARSINHQRKERAIRAFERSLMPIA